MAEEKVGFGFEFGIKGDKEIKKTFDDLFRMMGSATNAATFLGQALGKASGLLEFGAATYAIGAATTALGIFAYKSEQAGENLRQVRYQMSLLNQVSPLALSDSEISSNEDAVGQLYSKLGLEAGNTFTLSFLDRLKNFGKGAYAVNWDVQAAVANLFGAHLQSYEQTSPEAVAAQNQLAIDQGVQAKRLDQAQMLQKNLYAVERQSAQDLSDLYSQVYLSKVNFTGDGKNFDPRNATVTPGIMPESFLGRQRQMDITTNRLAGESNVNADQMAFDEARLRAMRKAPLTPNPLTGSVDLGSFNQRKQDELDLQQKINDEILKQLGLEKSIAEVDLQRREISRAFVSSQNYGSWRAIGGGGRSIFDSINGGPSIAERIGFIPGKGATYPGGARVHSGLGGNDPFGINGNLIQIEQLSELGDLNKNVKKIGIPTLAQ